MAKIIVKYYDDPEFYEYLKQLAKENRMSFSELVRVLIRLGLEEAYMRRLIKKPRVVDS